MIWQFVNCHETTHAQLSRKQRWRAKFHFHLKPSGSEFLAFALAFQTEIHVQSLFYIVVKILTLLYLVQSKILVKFLAIYCGCEVEKVYINSCRRFRKA